MLSSVPLRRANKFIFKQALRKFSETAKGWYWNIGKLHRKYTVKLYPNIVLVHCCTMLCTGVLYMLGLSQIMFCPCPPPMYTSEILYETESSY